jgi:hypothetical protein
VSEAPASEAPAAEEAVAAATTAEDAVETTEPAVEEILIEVWRPGRRQHEGRRPERQRGRGDRGGPRRDQQAQRPRDGQQQTPTPAVEGEAARSDCTADDCSYHARITVADLQGAGAEGGATTVSVSFG